MRKLKHFFIEVNGVMYADYTLWIDYYNGPVDDTILVEKSLLNQFYNSTLPKAHGVVPPKGSSLYVLPNCPLSHDDIRKNYSIKRKSDNADFIVSSRNSILKSIIWEPLIQSLLIVPNYKYAFGFTGEYSKERCIDNIRYAFEDILEEEMVFLSERKKVTVIKYEKSYLRFFKNESTQPLIDCSCLDLSTGNQLNTEVLRLVYQTGTIPSWRQEAEENYITELNVLNQYDWRKYPGTITLLMNMLCCGISRQVKEHLSRYSKPVKELLRTSEYWKNDADFKLSQEFIKDLLNIEDVKFANMADVGKKVNEYHIPWDRWYLLFNNVVRITPKQFENAGN